MATKLSDLFTVTESGSDFANCKGVLADALAKVREQQKTKCLETVAGFLTQFVSLRDMGVNSLKELRRQEKRQREQNAKVDRALAYFVETGNPMPIARLCGLDHNIRLQLSRLDITVDNDSLEVPADWQPKE